MLKSNIDVFFMTSFLCSLKFLLFLRIEYHKRCLGKKMKLFYGWVFTMFTNTFRNINANTQKGKI